MGRLRGRLESLCFVVLPRERLGEVFGRGDVREWCSGVLLVAKVSGEDGRGSGRQTYCILGLGSWRLLVENGLEVLGCLR